MGHPSWWGTAFDHVAALPHIRIVVVRWDGGDDAVIEWANDATAELVGTSAQDLSWRRISDVYPAQYLPEIIHQFRQAREHGSFTYEVMRELPSGRRTLAAVTTAMGDELFVSVAIEVTGEREAQRRLDEVARLTGAGLYHWNVAEDRIEWSDEMYRLLGYQPGEVEPSLALYFEHVHDDDRADLEVTASRPEEMYHHRHRVHRLDGELRTVDVRAQPITDADGQPLYLLGVVRDITDEVELEHQAELIRRAEEQQRTAITVHDKVVQSLATVVLALNLDEIETARTEALAAVAAAQDVVADLLAEVADVQGTIAPGALRVPPSDGDPT